eukprot:scaffold314023_cov26-Tisochrysis_lutea.AAC.1
MYVVSVHWLPICATAGTPDTNKQLPLSNTQAAVLIATLSHTFKAHAPRLQELSWCQANSLATVTVESEHGVEVCGGLRSSASPVGGKTGYFRDATTSPEDSSR